MDIDKSIRRVNKLQLAELYNLKDLLTSELEEFDDCMSNIPRNLTHKFENSHRKEIRKNIKSVQAAINKHHRAIQELLDKAA